MRNNYLIFTKFFSENRQSILSLLILCAFLCATLSHSAHSELLQESAELQQCKLCQHSIDTPPNVFTFKLVNVVDYYTPVQVVSTLYCKTPLYLVPQLRAPPAQ